MKIKTDVHAYIPQFFRCDIESEIDKLQNLIAAHGNIEIHDTIYSQLRELVKGRNASRTLTEEDYFDQMSILLNGRGMDRYGIWVFYPWSRRLVHLLDEEEFIEVRMQRNRYKITKEEQQTLATKTIGIIGLSVGQSVALTMAMERGFGELRLADFDLIELSNMNRIRTGVHNLGISKVVIAAREIAEIDPFLRVTCFTEGLQAKNMEAFFSDGGCLDLLVEECDSLDIKILARAKARELGVPVLMETNDRCMLDIERFDYEPDRPILHGLAGNLDPAKLKNLSDEEKVNILFQLLGIAQISTRGIVSMIEVGYSINSWSQLASSVALGGALVADVSRRILTGEMIQSGRIYVDPEELVRGSELSKSSEPIGHNPFKSIDNQEMIELAGLARVQLAGSHAFKALASDEVETLVKAGMEAPSTGNNQPWKWLYADKALFLFHDKSRSFNYANFNNISAFLSLGASIENVVIQASQLGLTSEFKLFPISSREELVAVFTFVPLQEPTIFSNKDALLAKHIYTRRTNRNLSEYKSLDDTVYGLLDDEARKIPYANVQWIREETAIRKAARLIAQCDRIHFLHKQCHYDLFKRELRWDVDSDVIFEDGIPVSTIGFTDAQLKMLQAIERPEVIDMLNKIGGGEAFEKMTFDSLSAATAIGLITMDSCALEPYLEGGRAYQRLWLEADRQKLSIQPFMAPVFLLPGILAGDVAGFSDRDVNEIKEIGQGLNALFELGSTQIPVFLFKLFCSDKAVPPPPRVALNNVLLHI